MTENKNLRGRKWGESKGKGNGKGKVKVKMN